MFRSLSNRYSWLQPERRAIAHGQQLQTASGPKWQGTAKTLCVLVFGLYVLVSVAVEGFSNHKRPATADSQQLPTASNRECEQLRTVN